MRRSLNKKSMSGARITRGCSGFTMIELVIAIAIVGILAGIAFYIYTNYISKAQVTVAVSTLDNVKKTLMTFNLDNGKYPASINFSGCVDEQGRTVFPSILCDQIKEDLYSIENYSSSSTGYVLTSRAKDNKHTLLTLTESNITIQGN
ncbi:MAG: prepilin-type N-terminal cleavage/methylation domain-containing protein [Smithella sp.]|jgi:prepilin-type N-terminal cleavage/methylation domain-containing protein